MAAATPLSRSQAQRAVRDGRVTVDDAPVKDPACKPAAGSHVCLDGEPVEERGSRYFMLHKPVGYVCATEDDRYPTVLELLPVDERAGLHIVGRLDVDTTGLVLLTDDGDWSHRITSPKHRCDKRYRVSLAQPLAEGDLLKLQQGVALRADTKPTLPAEVEQLDATTLLLTLQEGRYHQVKRMFGALGNRVIKLHRERIGALALDEQRVPLGEFRALNPAEVAALG